jgi:hypothetical protein
VSDVADQLTKLAALHRSGALSDAEFDAAKAKLLGAATPPQPPGWPPLPPPPSQASPTPFKTGPAVSERRRHPVRNSLGFLGFVILAIVIVVAAPGGNLTTGKSTTGKPAAPSSGTPGIGHVAKDGDFAFVVKSVTCGASAAAAVNSGGFGERIPSGAKECLVTMAVTADKRTAQTFFACNQYAYDATGRKFSTDGDGVLYLAHSNYMTQVNPGITIVALVPFQIPSTDQLVRLELHDSAFSAGVTVGLGA